ncbi:hypothetical protein EPN81_03925 [Patescibacteria group bacterium]|nr:MAG: hypothetical protein EPN81_03925 [Patescibacteria group bacterium]
MPRVLLIAGLLLGSFTACTPGSVVVNKGDCDDCDDDVTVDDDATHTGDDDATTDDDATAPADDDATPTDADGDGYDTGEPDCDDGNPDVHPGATETDNGIDDDCDGVIDEGFDADDDTSDDDATPADEPQLTVTITTPGGLEYGSMICHIEYLEDGDNDGSFADEYWGWEFSWVENWVSQTTLESNPGVIDAVRLNCTLCPGELTLAQEPLSPEAESMGCTWTAVNGSSSTNGSVGTWYFGETFGSSLVSVAGGTSVLVDLR